MTLLTKLQVNNDDKYVKRICYYFDVSKKKLSKNVSIPEEEVEMIPFLLSPLTANKLTIDFYKL